MRFREMRRKRQQLTESESISILGMPHRAHSPFSGMAATPSRTFGSRPSGNVASNGGNAPKGNFGGARR